MSNTLYIGWSLDKLFLVSGQFSATVKDSQDITSVDIKTSVSVAGVDTAPIGLSTDNVDTWWVGATDTKLYRTSGQFSSTLKDSISVSSVDTSPRGISWDGTNTPWVGQIAGKLYLQSGKFDTQLKTSRDVTLIGLGIYGVSWDGTHTPWVGQSEDKLYLQSGQFDSQVKTSQSVKAGETFPSGIADSDFDARVPAGAATAIPMAAVQYRIRRR
jgi:hypothetical protein